MKSWGLTLVLFGALAIVIPMVTQAELLVLSWLPKDKQPLFAGGLIAAGIVLFVLGSRRKKPEKT